MGSEMCIRDRFATVPTVCRLYICSSSEGSEHRLVLRLPNRTFLGHSTRHRRRRRRRRLPPPPPPPSRLPPPRETFFPTTTTKKTTILVGVDSDTSWRQDDSDIDRCSSRNPSKSTNAKKSRCFLSSSSSSSLPRSFSLSLSLRLSVRSRERAF